jgi:futalosine hydrolase
MLLVFAAPNEAKCIAEGVGCEVPQGGFVAWRVHPHGPLSLLQTGVGKANACGAVAQALATGRYRAVISLGIGGCLPHGAATCTLGEVVLGDRSIFADEGVQTEQEFRTIESLGFGAFPDGRGETHADPELLTLLGARRRRVGPIATVSTCSGTDGLAQAVASRTGALVEAMEGAGVLLAAARAGVAAAEIRVVSNTTGDRSRQVWKMPLAMSTLAAVAAEIRAIAASGF